MDIPCYTLCFSFVRSFEEEQDQDQDQEGEKDTCQHISSVVLSFEKSKRAPQQQFFAMNSRFVFESHSPLAAHSGHMRLSSTHNTEDFDDDR